MRFREDVNFESEEKLVFWNGSAVNPKTVPGSIPNPSLLTNSIYQIKKYYWERFFRNSIVYRYNYKFMGTVHLVPPHKFKLYASIE